MSGRKNILITLGFGLFVGLTASGGCVLLLSRYYSRLLFDLLNALCEAAAAREPEATVSRCSKPGWPRWA